MKIKKEEIENMIREGISRKLDAMLTENADYTATKSMELSVEEACYNLEKDLVKALNLVLPDYMPEPIRARYIQIVDNMKEQINNSVLNAIEELAPFPRAQVSTGSRKKSW